MASNLLTETKCKHPKPKPGHDPQKAYRMNDGEGMYLQVMPTGSRLWRMKYNINGKTKLASFGKYPYITLGDARIKRTALKKQVAKGVDPAIIKQAEKADRDNIFRVRAKAWHDKKKLRWTEGHAASVWRSLDLYVFPEIGDKPIKEITAPIALATAEKIIETRGAHETARQVLGRMSAIISLAVAEGHAPHNPAIGMSAHLTEREKSTPLPSIDWQKLPALLKAIDDSDMFAQTEAALRFLMLTFVRPGELRFAKWDEIDTDNNMWNIPAERMKMKRPHQVPLSTQAVALLEQLKVFSGDSEYILPGRMTSLKPISENTLLFAIYRIGYKGQMTPHGCRALASTWLNEKGEFKHKKQWRSFNPDAIERQLAHGEPNKIRDVYNRADYMGERETMMQVWADFIDRQADQSGKVVNIREKVQKR